MAYLRGSRQRTFLAVLLINSGATVPKEQLIDEIWGEAPPAQVDNALQAVVTRLRRSLCGAGLARERLASERSGYRLSLEEDELDLLQFDARWSEARRLARADPQRAAVVLGRALALWRGTALQGVRGGLLCHSASIRLEEMRLLALEEKIDLQLQGVQHTDAVAELRQLTVLHPLHERFSEQLMVALHRVGRVAEAVNVYQTLRATLLKQLGIEPSPALQERMRSILQHHTPAPGDRLSQLPEHRTS